MCTCATLSWAFTFLQLLSSFTSTRSEIVVNTVESTSAAPLVLQDINLIVVTDVHSWVAGHKHNNTIDANYGKKEIIKLFNFETSNFKLYNTRARAQSFSAFSATWYETRGVMDNVRVAPQ
jgi:hypothetical protein